MLSHLKCGLLSEKLGHSLSPSLYKKLESYEYKLYEKSMDEALDFLRFGDYDVLNVTVPYKELAFSICDVVMNSSIDATFVVGSSVGANILNVA